MRLYYAAWQIAAGKAAQRMSQQRRFDLAWHLTWANMWYGSPAVGLDIPLIFGPVGGAVLPPLRLVPELGVTGALRESARACGILVLRCNPLYHRTLRKARLILVQNHETFDAVPERHHRKTVVFPNALVDASLGGGDGSSRSTGEFRTALFAGRLLPWKGVSLAIKAIASCPRWRFVIVGSGPDEVRLRRLVARLRVSDRVEFYGHRPRVEVFALMTKVDALLLPSMRDDSPFVVAEAVAFGLPVLCLDRGGAALLGGKSVPSTSPNATVNALADQLIALETSYPQRISSRTIDSVAPGLLTLTSFVLTASPRGNDVDTH